MKFETKHFYDISDGSRLTPDQSITLGSNSWMKDRGLLDRVPDVPFIQGEVPCIQGEVPFSQGEVAFFKGQVLSFQGEVPFFKG